MTTTPVFTPERIAHLPRDERGYHVPWFVAWLTREGAALEPGSPEAKPDFRVIRPDGIAEALNGEKCWICGGRLGRNVAFVIGPMCAVNRVSAEPPSHRECAIYAAQACPFLTNPRRHRQDSAAKPLPGEAVAPAGTMIARNPGVALIWITGTYGRKHRGWYPFRVGEGLLIDIGEPAAVMWFAHGRPATREEVLASINSGLPLLKEQAEQDGARALEELDRAHARALQLLPAAA